MISLKDYAKNNGISYEAVRQQVKRYKVELQDHIYKENKTQFLDEEAVIFLDEKRKKNPVHVIQQEKNEELEVLRAENKSLLVQIAELQNQLIKKDEKIDQLKDEKIALLENKPEYQKTFFGLYRRVK